jgi:hypothetical protein
MLSLVSRTVICLTLFALSSWLVARCVFGGHWYALTGVAPLCAASALLSCQYTADTLRLLITPK